MRKYKNRFQTEIGRREVEAVFNRLKTDFYGIENGKPQAEVADSVGLSVRDLRRVCAEINACPEYNGIVSTSGMTYLCKTKEEAKHSLLTSYRAAFSLLKKARQMEKKIGLNNQEEYDFVDDKVKIKVIYEDKE